MAKIIALDVGTKRTGVAETDPFQIIATGLPTLDTSQLLPFLAQYVATEQPKALVIGAPVRLHGEASDIETYIANLIVQIKLAHPMLPIYRVDERFTSKIAAHTLSLSGLSKKKRQEKGRIDEISAVLILQSFMQQNRFKLFG